MSSSICQAYVQIFEIKIKWTDSFKINIQQLDNLGDGISIHLGAQVQRPRDFESKEILFKKQITAIENKQT